ncbi:hypothetical protein CYMTET_52423 [Cymbomonas tetramitiformis]|uniref:Uncharacterized protein n=1 Tax=Cymbomonas tetramitiformis TaxID=36881 RepID=A0AAE0BK77_9CHLO|nr:hypothetical protein CYMTET_52423 [Cymbomonas tetramitiformis]
MHHLRSGFLPHDFVFDDYERDEEAAGHNEAFLIREQAVKLVADKHSRRRTWVKRLRESVLGGKGVKFVLSVMRHREARQAPLMDLRADFYANGPDAASFDFDDPAKQVHETVTRSSSIARPNLYENRKSTGSAQRITS